MKNTAQSCDFWPLFEDKLPYLDIKKTFFSPFFTCHVKHDEGVRTIVFDQIDLEIGQFLEDAGFYSFPVHGVSVEIGPYSWLENDLTKGVVRSYYFTLVLQTDVAEFKYLTILNDKYEVTAPLADWELEEDPYWDFQLGDKHLQVNKQIQYFNVPEELADTFVFPVENLELKA